jgi:hypothetical protein
MFERSSINARALNPYIPIWIAVIAFTFYLISLHPSVGWGVSADVALHTLNPESTNSLYHPFRVLIGQAAGFLTSVFPVPHDALQNGVSTAAAAVAITLVYVISVRLGWNRASAIITCLTLGLSQLFWHLAGVSGPFTIMMVLFLLIVYTTMRWTASVSEHQIWWVAGASFLTGLGIGESPFFLFVLPGFVVLLASAAHTRNRLWSPLLFLLFLIAGYGASLTITSLMTNGLSVHDLLPLPPPVLERTVRFDEIPSNLASYGALLFYQFPLFGLLLGLFGCVVQRARGQGIWWILLFPILLTLPFYSNDFPDQQYFVASLTFVAFTLWIGSGLGWFLRYASLRRDAMNSSYGSLLTGVIAVMCLSPLMLYGAVETVEEQPVLKYLLPERSFPRMSRESYYLVPWEVEESGAKLLHRDTRSIPDQSILVVDYGAAAAIRYYNALEETSGHVSFRNPNTTYYQSNPVKTVRRWLQQRSTHAGTPNEKPARGVYSLNSHPMFRHEQLRSHFTLDQPLLTRIGTASPRRDTRSGTVRPLERVERSPIWRIRLPARNE